VTRNSLLQVIFETLLHSDSEENQRGSKARDDNECLDKATLSPVDHSLKGQRTRRKETMIVAIAQATENLKQSRTVALPSMSIVSLIH
jgi:hypothetical protein